MVNNGRVFPDFLNNPAETVAERLLGCVFKRTLDGRQILVRIVETEAYDEDDAASHTFRGRTRRNEVMFGEAGHLYVYFTYGMHHCCNVVCGPAGHGAAALIRAVEPVSGTELLEEIRGKTGTEATNGPAKLCQALAIGMELNGHDLRREPIRLEAGGLAAGESVSRSTRIGISKATEAIRRFTIAGNPWVSRPWPVEAGRT